MMPATDAAVMIDHPRATWLDPTRGDGER